MSGSARTNATRRGSKASGIRVAAQSWVGSIIVELDGDPSDPRVTLRVAQGSQSCGGRIFYQGSLVALASVNPVTLVPASDPREREDSEAWASDPARYIQHTAETCHGRPCGSGCDHNERIDSELAREVLKWASTPGEHGGNPYCHTFVSIARKLVGE